MRFIDDYCYRSRERSEVRRKKKGINLSCIPDHPIELIRKRMKFLNASRIKDEILFVKMFSDRFGDIAFHRNYPLLNCFYGDFVCLDRMLVVEIDGPDHNNKKEYDARRDSFLRKYGFRVLRLSSGNYLDWAPALKHFLCGSFFEPPVRIRKKRLTYKITETFDDYLERGGSVIQLDATVCNETLDSSFKTYKKHLERKPFVKRKKFKAMKKKQAFIERLNKNAMVNKEFVPKTVLRKK